MVRARRLTLALLLAALHGCLLAPQRLDAPCVGKSPDLDGGACPACATDADCSILSNSCLEAASCVPRAGNWAVIDIGCNVTHAPTTQTCACVDQVCTAR